MNPSRRPLIALLAANYISWFGNAVALVAIPLYVLSETGSAAKTGMAGFAGALPLIFAGIAGGVLIDRFGGRKVGIIADLSAGLLTLAVPVLVATVGLPMPVLLAILFGRTLVASPAGTARISQLAPLAEQCGVRLETATTFYQSAQRLALVLGPPLAGLLVAGIGPVQTLYIDAGSFVVAAVLVAVGVSARKRSATPAHADKVGFARSTREGFAFVKATPVIAAITGVVFVTNFIDDAFTPVLLPVYSTQVLGDVRTLGWLLAATGIGAVLGTFSYAPLSRHLMKNRRATFLSCFAAVALLRTAMVALPDFTIMAALAFLIGLAAGPLNPLLSTVMAERVPLEMRGRVFGLTNSLAFAAVPFGILSAGWAVEGIGLQPAMAIFAAIYLALIAVTLPSRALGDLNTPAPAKPMAAPEPLPA